MYAVYTYAAGATTQNIANDIAALLTGTTDKTLLSAACVQASTSILTDYDQAGWTMHDNAAAASQIVIKAPIADNPAQYKYCLIDFGSAAGYFGTSLYESWNATTHVGANVADFARPSSKSSYWQKLNTTSGGVIYLSASARRIVAAGVVGGVWGNPNSWGGIAERTRDMPWDTVAAGYVPAAWIAPHAFNAAMESAQAPRVKNATTGTDVATANFGITIPCKSTTTYISNEMSNTIKALNGNNVMSYIIMPLLFAQIKTHAYFGSNMSSVSDIWIFAPWYGSHLDEITMNGKTYVLWMNHYNLNQHGSLLVPKG